MSVIECRTADEVRELARLVRERRRKSYHKRVLNVFHPPPPPRMAPVVAPVPAKIEEVPIKVMPVEPQMKTLLHQLVDEAQRLTSNPSQVISDLKMLQLLVCKAWKIHIVDLLAHRHHKKESQARHVFFLLARALTTHSLPSIGRVTSGRDHTTVLHGVKKYDWLLQELRKELSPNDAYEVWVNRAYELVVGGNNGVDTER